MSTNVVLQSSIHQSALLCLLVPVAGVVPEPIRAERRCVIAPDEPRKTLALLGCYGDLGVPREFVAALQSGIPSCLEEDNATAIAGITASRLPAPHFFELVRSLFGGRVVGHEEAKVTSRFIEGLRGTAAYERLVLAELNSWPGLMTRRWLCLGLSPEDDNERLSQRLIDHVRVDHELAFYAWQISARAELNAEHHLRPVALDLLAGQTRIQDLSTEIHSLVEWCDRRTLDAEERTRAVVDLVGRWNAGGVDWNEIFFAFRRAPVAIRECIAQCALESDCDVPPLGANETLRKQLAAGSSRAWRLWSRVLYQPGGVSRARDLFRTARLPDDPTPEFWEMLWRALTEIREWDAKLRACEHFSAPPEAAVWGDEVLERVLQRPELLENASAGTAAELLRYLAEAPKQLGHPRLAEVLASAPALSSVAVGELPGLDLDNDAAVRNFSTLYGQRGVSRVRELVRADLAGVNSALAFIDKPWLSVVLDDDLRMAVKAAAKRYPMNSLMDAALRHPTWFTRDEVMDLAQANPRDARVERLCITAVPREFDAVLVHRLRTSADRGEKCKIVMHLRDRGDLRTALVDALVDLIRAGDSDAPWLLGTLLQTRNALEKHAKQVGGELLRSGRAWELRHLMFDDAHLAAALFDDSSGAPERMAMQHDTLARIIIDWAKKLGSRGEADLATRALEAMRLLAPPKRLSEELRRARGSKSLQTCPRALFDELIQAISHGTSRATPAALISCIAELSALCRMLSPDTVNDE